MARIRAYRSHAQNYPDHCESYEDLSHPDLPLQARSIFPRSVGSTLETSKMLQSAMARDSSRR